MSSFYTYWVCSDWVGIGKIRHNINRLLQHNLSHRQILPLLPLKATPHERPLLWLLLLLPPPGGIPALIRIIQKTLLWIPQKWILLEILWWRVILILRPPGRWRWRRRLLSHRWHWSLFILFPGWKWRILIGWWGLCKQIPRLWWEGVLV